MALTYTATYTASANTDICHAVCERRRRLERMPAGNPGGGLIQHAVPDRHA